MPRQPFDRWLRGEAPESPAEPPGVRLTLEEAERLQVLLANAGGLLRRFEPASPWLPGGQHYADGLLAGAQDLQRRLLDARFAACPAEFPSSPSNPCCHAPSLPDRFGGLIPMLLMFLALVVVVCLLIRRDPKRQPNDPKRAARKQQGRMWMIAALALLAGLTLGHAPLVGPPVSGGVTSVASFLTGTSPTGDQQPQPAPKPKPKPKR